MPEKKHYVVVYCHVSNKKVAWNQLEFDAPGLYEASEMFFESPVIKEIYPDLKQVWFRKECGCCGTGK